MKIEWAVVCDLAYFDRHDRLCIVGITPHFAFPSLPVGLHQIMVVARLTDIAAIDEIAVQMEFIVPGGEWARHLS